jgi:hypothetical protein
VSIFRTHSGENDSRKSAFIVAATVLCLVLMTLLSVAQVVHTHPNPNDTYTCPLCVTMHSIVPAAAAAAAVVLVQLGVSVPVPKARELVRYWNPKFFTRPPPIA